MRLVLSSLIVIAGLLSSQATAATTPEQTASADIRDSGFVYCVSGQVNTFNPQKASSGLIVDTLAAQLYDRLLDVDPYTYRLVPELAESWEVLDNGATYRFHLRRDVSFQKTAWFTPTRKLNADDVVFTFQRIFDRRHPWHNINGSSFPYFDSLQFADNVKSVRKLDNNTVEFRLTQPDASFLWHLATHYASVMSAEYAAQLSRKDRQELLDRQPVGTGPFQLSEYRAGQFIRLQRHDGFWRGKPLMPQVVVDLGSGGTGRLSKLLTGECDVLAWPAASQLTILRDDPRLRLTLRPGMNIAYLAFNTDKPPLNNPAVRHALALSINNQRLMQSIYYGTAETAASILPRASWAYDNDAKITEYNPQKSREQLKALGIENLTLHLWVPTSSQAWNPSPLKTAELIQADMAQVGVKVVIVPVEGRFQEARLMDMNHDLTLSGWATDSNDPDSFFRPLLSCAAINSQTNFAHWCNPEFDSVLRKALSSQQLASRIEAYEEAQNILEKELPILPLASSLRLQAYRYDIKGLVLSPFGNASFAGVSREKTRRGEKTMIIFTLRRLLLLLVTLFFLTFIGFSLSYFTPHAPLQGASLWNAWIFWFNGLLHWDFGVSSINGQLISEQLKEVFPATMELCILAFGFALMVGIPVGMLAGVTRSKWPDRFISALALLGFSIPVFWLALLLTLFFSLTLGWLPVSGRFDLLYEVKPVTGFAIIDAWISDSPWRDEMVMSAIRHMVLPVLTLSVAPTTEVIRLMRISTIEVYDQNYVKAAATRGLSRFTILRRHVLHNALPPVIPRLGLQFSTMLTLAMITEMVFSWPGLGRWLIHAIRQQDYAAISAGVMVIGSLVIVVNVISDILGAMANPLKHKEWYALR